MAGRLPRRHPLTPPFWLSDGVLLAAQAATVALPERRELPGRFARASRLYALIPVLALVGTIVAINATTASADALTDLALVAVPPLAALALAWAARVRHRGLWLLPVALFALAAIDRDGLAGQTAALALSALSCVTLGVLLAAVTPGRWLKVGIVVMAIADAYLVGSDLLAQPNAFLNAAAPPAGLPQLQRAEWGSAVMGYGDLFVAGLLGGLLAREGRSTVRAALLVFVLAAAFDLLFFAVNELPATVPVALALLVLEAARSRRLAR